MTVSTTWTAASLYGYEIAGSSASISNSTGSGAKPTATPHVVAYKPPVNSIVIACGGFPDSAPPTAGPGYTLDKITKPYSAGEHRVRFPGGSTTSPSNAATAPTDHWTEVSASII